MTYLTHGRIVGATAAVPDLDASLRDYRDRLGLRVVEQGRVSADLASSWGAAGVTGARYAALQPTSGAPCTLRLIEQPLPADFVPTRSFGWAAFEITVQDVFGWPGRLVESGFDIVGTPREIPGMPYFVAMQMLGRGREMIYLNEVRSDTPTADLPPARSPVDHVFIVILATRDRAGTMAWYRARLGMVEDGPFTIAYTMISRAFGLPLDSPHTLSMAQVGRMPVVEVDDYPAEATVRATQPGMLPPGNSIVTLAVAELNTRGLDFIAPPAVRGGAVYGGRRVATVCGPAGELLELVEL